MSTKLDQILERVERFGIRNAWVLFVHLEEKVKWAPNPSEPWRKVLLYRHSQEPMAWGLPGGVVAREAPERQRTLAESQTGLACDSFRIRSTATAARFSSRRFIGSGSNSNARRPPRPFGHTATSHCRVVPIR